jgi:hypothetical protein
MPLGPFDNHLQIGPPPPLSFMPNADPNAPIVQEPLEDKESILAGILGGGGGAPMSPGQPTGRPGGGGGFDWKGAGKMAIAAPIVAALVSKLSGGSVDMGSALASLGGGFLNTKLEQQKAKRAQTMDQENRMMDLAHKSVQGLGKLTPETLAKFPKLQSLSQKYQDALANDGIISPKEAAEIVTSYEMAKADMAAAGLGQDETRRSEQMTKDFEQTRELRSQGRFADFADQMPNADGVTPEDKMGLAKEMIWDRENAQLERETPTPMEMGGQNVMVTPAERRAELSRRETQRHNEKMEELRARQAGARSSAEGRQALLAQFTSDQAEWQMALQTALAQVDDDPDLKKEIMAEFRTTMPRKADYIGGLPPKLDRKALDEVGAKYGANPQKAPDGGPPTPLAPKGGGFDPAKPVTAIKFGGKTYPSFEALPPEGKAAYLKATGGKR